MLVHRKSANTSTFSLIVFVGISEIWDAFLVSKWKSFFSMSCVVTSVRENLFLPLYLAWMVRIFGWFFLFHYGF